MADRSRIDELQRRVQMDPASIAFAALAEEYRRTGRPEEAIAICQTGLRRHPAYLSARVTLGLALLETGRFDEARRELEHVLKVAPDNVAAVRAMAEIHNRARESVQHDARETPPDPDAGRGPEPSARPVPIRVSAVPPDQPAPGPQVQASHPDEAALPALESLLAAIVRSRHARARRGSDGPDRRFPG